MVQRRPEVPEADFIRRMEGFLDDQGGTFDETDLDRIGTFLDNNLRLREDWGRILTALEDDAEDDAIEPVLRKLRDRIVTVDEAIANYKKQNGITSPLTIFVGAGGSAPLPTQIPTVQSLLPILWVKAAEIGSKPLLRLQRQCDALDIRNIEDLLTAIYLAQGAVGNSKITLLLRGLLEGQAPSEEGVSPNAARFSRVRRGADRNQPAIEVVESLRESLQTLFSLLVGMMVGKPRNPIHEAIASYCSESRDTTIITTNYDLCIESAITSGRYTYEAIAPQNDESEESDYGVVRVLKLHGSLNWYACLSCDRYVAADIESIDRAFQTGLYPVIAMCQTCQATSQQLIVPPITQKYQIHPRLLDIRQAAEQALSLAKVIIVVGYSFTENDEYILRMVSRAVEADPDKDVLILDTDNAPARRFRQFVGTHARNFDFEKRVRDFVGDAAVTMPALLKPRSKMGKSKSNLSKIVKKVA